VYPLPQCASTVRTEMSSAGAWKQLRWSSDCGQGPEDCSRRTDQQWQKLWGSRIWTKKCAFNRRIACSFVGEVGDFFFCNPAYIVCRCCLVKMNIRRCCLVCQSSRTEPGNCVPSVFLEGQTADITQPLVGFFWCFFVFFMCCCVPWNVQHYKFRENFRAWNPVIKVQPGAGECCSPTYRIWLETIPDLRFPT